MSVRSHATPPFSGPLACAASLAILLLTTRGWSQIEDPTLDDASVDEVHEQMRSRPQRADPVPAVARPVTRPSSSLPADGDLARWLSERGIGVAMGRVLPAGTFLSRRAGVVLRAPSGERILVFSPASGGEGDLPPMVLLPSSTLMRMDAITLEGEGTLPILVTGETTVYRGRNYLLPTEFAPLTVQAERAVVPDPGDASEDPASEPPIENLDIEALEGDPRVRELMEELAVRRGGARGIGGEQALPSRGESRASGRAQTPGLIPEGDFISRRRARLSRMGGGSWGVAFDSSTMLPGRSDAPLLLLPCLMLERLERMAERTEREIVLEVSGRVYTYEGVNYLLPVLATVLPPDDVQGMP